jgi:predicted PurR-regulated permease PerM
MAASGPSTRTIVRVFFTVAALAVGLYLLYQVRTVLGLVAMAVFLAVALGPGVDFFVRRKVPRGLSILLVYLSIGVAVIGIGLLVVPPIVTQVNAFAKELPTYIKDAQKNKTIRKYDRRYKIFDKLQKQASQLPSRLGDAAGALQSVTVGVFSTLVQLVTVLTMTFFLLLDGGRVFDWVLGLLRPHHEDLIRDKSREVYHAVAGYVAGNLVISFIAGTTAWLTLTVLGVPFAVPLAVLMAFLDLIPLIGATIGGIAIGIVTVFNDFPTSTIVWAVVFILYQQVENNVIQPIVYRRTVDVQPLVVIISILVGSTLLGVLGALVAIPVAATLQILLRDLWRRRPPTGGLVVVEDQPTDPAPPGPQSVA